MHTPSKPRDVSCCAAGDTQYGDSQDYDLVADDEGEAPLPPPPGKTNLCVAFAI